MLKKEVQEFKQILYTQKVNPEWLNCNIHIPTLLDDQCFLSFDLTLSKE